ncbi:cellobiose-phosphate degrading protein [Clostridioides difficile]|nr:cellobiose-phosphate degrading protein [Clostridioides difficile]
MKKLVVRADDIGYSEGVTLGIISSYKNGIVTSAGIMVNMPFSRKAIEMVKNDDICFGLHVNLVIGEPCCKKQIKIKNLLDEGGKFVSSKIRRAQLLTGKDIFNYEEVYEEVCAQIETYKLYMNKLPEYIDIHGIEDDVSISAMCDAGKEHGIPSCPYYLDSSISMPSKYPQNHFYKLDKSFVKLFEEKYINLDKDITLMVTHPGFIDYNLIKSSSLVQERVYEHAMLCDKDVKMWLKRNNIELVDFRDLLKANN